MIRDINDYLDDRYEHEQYDYKILLYGNYTYRDNLEADSLVEVLRPVSYTHLRAHET